jgi:predicted  nucleic acid-binding Zn-ribbon protein
VPEPFDTLLRVQDLDTLITQLQHRRASLPERLELNTIEARTADLARQAAEVGAARQALVTREDELEARIAGFNERRQAIETRMLADRSSAARDLQAMNEEIRHLDVLKVELEDAELALMEEQEPLDAELERLTAEQATAVHELERLRVAVAEAETEIRAELAEAEPKRVAEAAALPSDLADRYERLRARLKGTGAARLIGNRCDGCHLELPAVEVDRIRHLSTDEIVTCDQCGRILVRVTG